MECGLEPNTPCLVLNPTSNRPPRHISRSGEPAYLLWEARYLGRQLIFTQLYGPLTFDRVSFSRKGKQIRNQRKILRRLVYGSCHLAGTPGWHSLVRMALKKLAKHEISRGPDGKNHISKLYKSKI